MGHRGLGQPHLDLRQRELPAALAVPLERGQRRENAEHESVGRGWWCRSIGVGPTYDLPAESALETGTSSSPHALNRAFAGKQSGTCVRRGGSDLVRALWGVYRTRPDPVPAGDLARLEPDERARVASAAAEAQRAPATRRAYAAQWALFDTWCAALEASPAGGRRLPRRARRAVEAGHGPERGGRDRRRLPRGRASGPDEDPARRRRASRHRPPARRAAWRGAASGARPEPYDQARELMLARPGNVAGAAAGSSKANPTAEHDELPAARGGRLRGRSRSSAPPSARSSTRTASSRSARTASTSGSRSSRNGPASRASRRTPGRRGLATELVRDSQQPTRRHQGGPARVECRARTRRAAGRRGRLPDLPTGFGPRERRVLPPPG